MTIQLGVWIDDAEHGPDALRESVALINECLFRFSRFNPNSDIGRINRNLGNWTQISEMTMQLLTCSLAGIRKTNGMFTPFLHNALCLLGYSQSFEKGPAFQIAPDAAAMSTGVLDFDWCNLRVRTNVAIDLGGIAKGWLADYASRKLTDSSIGSVVEIGGDLKVNGHGPDKCGWKILLPSDYKIENGEKYIRVRGVGIATSGISKRAWVKSNKTVHQIIDPRTGLSALSDVAKVTVVDESAASAEIFAKALIILGSVEGIRWIDRNTLAAVMGVRSDGSVFSNRRLERFLSP